VSEQNPAVSGYGEHAARPDAESRLPAVLWSRRPRVVVKSDLLPGVSVLSTIAVVGVAIGWIWSVIAPAERLLITDDGTPVPLLDESYHRFDDLGVFLLVNLAAGLILGAVVWQLRERRGPVIMIAAVLGAAVGGWLAMRTGVAFAHGGYPAPASPHPGGVVTKAPGLGTSWVLLAQPLAVAFAYGVLSAWNGRHDLGRRLG
jgi:hypothetical protein